MHLRTLIPLRRDTYRVIRETLTGFISGGLRVDVVAARVAKAADAIYVMRDECQGVRDLSNSFQSFKFFPLKLTDIFYFTSHLLLQLISVLVSDSFYFSGIPVPLFILNF